MITVCIKTGMPQDGPAHNGTPNGQALRWLNNNVEPLDKTAFENLFRHGLANGKAKIVGQSGKWEVEFNIETDEYEYKLENEEIASLFVIQFDGRVK